MIKKIVCALLCFTLYLPLLHSEYRVYEYYLKPKLGEVDVQEAYVITSTLDPVSYLSYHGGAESVQLELLRTWICKGYTGHKKDLCSAPLESFSKLEEDGQDKGA